MSFLIFQKKLSQTDVKHRLSIPSEAIDHLPPFPEGSNSVILTVRVGSDCSVRELRCFRRPGYFPRLIIQGGWMQIVREMDLMPGDLLMFFKEGNDRLYRIEVKRTTTLTGEDISPDFNAPSSISSPTNPSKWKKIEYIGGGSFGSVSVASNRETGELCAVKQLYDINNLKSAEFLRQEIQFLSQMNHPNIVKYYGSVTVGGQICLYMEYIQPGSLKKYISERGALEESLVRNFTAQILSGLEYLHSRRKVHRDIKPHNLLIDSNNTVKLADFGLAKHIYLSVGNHSVKGTKHYAAPEIIENKDYNSSVEASAGDIWSLGLVIIEMLTGKHPWGHLDEVNVMYKVCVEKENPSIPETLSQEGKDFLNRCFIRTPAERPSARELLGHSFVTGQPQVEQAKTLS